MTKQEIIDHFYPIGSGYLTTSDMDDPNITLGGVWEKIPEGYFININTGELMINDGDGYTTTKTIYNTQDLYLNESQQPRHTHLLPTLGNGVSGTKQLTIYVRNNTDPADKDKYGDKSFLCGYMEGVNHAHSMVHAHTYDPIHVNVYLWKRIG